MAITTHPDLDVELLDLNRGGVTVVAGGSGTGKSVFARGVALRTLDAGGTVLISDLGKHGADYTTLGDKTVDVSRDVDSSTNQLVQVGEEHATRSELCAEHGVRSVAELPEELQPAPLLLIIEEYTQLYLHLALPANADGYAHTESILFTLNIAEATAGRELGITILLLSQKFTIGSAVAIPKFRDPDTRINRLVLGRSNSSTLWAAFTNPGAAPSLPLDAPRGAGVFEPAGGTPRIVHIPRR